MFVFHLRDFFIVNDRVTSIFQDLYALYYLFWEMKYSGLSYDFFFRKQDGSRFVLFKTHEFINSNYKQKYFILLKSFVKEMTRNYL